MPRLRALIVGAGFGGIAAAIALKNAGVREFVLVDRADGVGGTWRANTYPGAACDIPCHLYSLSYAPKTDWSRRYASQPEILDYLEGVVDRFRLRPHLRLNTTLTEARWDEERALWVVRADDDTVWEVELLIAATGQLSRPSTPKVPGLDAFEGEILHSARWNPAFQPLGRRVAVVGTGASAIQIVPALAKQATQLYVVQRSPPWILPKWDADYGLSTRAALTLLPGLRLALRLRIWAWLELCYLGFRRAGWANAAFRLWCEHHMRAQIPDPALRARLTPDYTVGCKRGLISDDYYPALQRPNVELLDSALERLGPRTLTTADGRTREVDAVVFATGFSTGDFLAPLRVYGRRDESLADAWRDGVAAYLGITVPRFPNLFLVYGPNTNLGHSSMVFMIERQCAYIRRCVAALQARGRQCIEVREGPYAAWGREMRARLKHTVWEAGCTNWYRHEGRNTNSWPGSTLEYAWRTRVPDLRHYELR